MFQEVFGHYLALSQFKMSLKERVPNIRPMGQMQHAKKVLFCQTEGLCKVKETAIH